MLTTSDRQAADATRAGHVELRRRMAVVAAVTFIVGLAAVNARATYGARTTADEPQYLLTAISLSEDFDLDISDEITDQRYLPFHEIPVNPQTIDLNDSGQRISPHDPLLPLLLALPMRLGGWRAAKAALSVVAGITAAMTLWVAVRRFDADVKSSTWVVGSLFVAPPLVSYATQVYPAMPAALCVVLGVAAVTGPRERRWEWVGVASVIALPWLSVKYVPIAAVIGGALLFREARSNRGTLILRATVLAASGVIYLMLHKRIYGGWTVYATGDHFVNGELLVVGNNPNYVGRSRRLIGLIVDRGFGLAAWNPVYLAIPMTIAAFVKRRTPNWPLVLALMATGWAMATWIALTMHGWWWPGRQVVPLLPLVAIVLAVVVGRTRRRIVAVSAISAVALAGWLWLTIEASTARLTLIVDFEETTNPIYSAWRVMLPDHRHLSGNDVVLTVVWGLAFLALTIAVWRRRPAGVTRAQTRADEAPEYASV